MKYLGIGIVLVSMLLGCSSFEEPEYRTQFQISVQRIKTADTLTLKLANPLHSSLKITAYSRKPLLQQVFDSLGTFSVPALDSVSLIFPIRDTNWVPMDVQLSARFNESSKSDSTIVLGLPWPEGKTYRVIQAYDGTFSHNTPFSRRAIDFNLQIGDTVCAAADGFVVGVIEDYTDGGNDERYRDFANYITLFHPQFGVYTQYVHLHHRGAFVVQGDTVTSGQAIGLSGLTGFTAGPHLHFNTFSYVNDTLISIPVSFQEGYPGADLAIGDLLHKKGSSELKKFEPDVRL